MQRIADSMDTLIPLPLQSRACGSAITLAMDGHIAAPFPQTPSVGSGGCAAIKPPNSPFPDSSCSNGPRVGAAALLQPVCGAHPAVLLEQRGETLGILGLVDAECG
jgi:hypothetical protein